MKIIAQTIEMLAHFKEDGKISPIKFKIKEGDDYKIIKITKIISTDLEKLCGNHAQVFACMVVIDGIEKICEIKYFLEDCKWVVFKI